MRASPPIQIALTRFGWWRAGVAAAALLCTASLAAWWLTQPGRPPIELTAAAGAGIVLAAAAGCSLIRRAPSSLRWDGRHWYVAASGSQSREPLQGQLTVAIDLGPWLLLRFVAAAPRRPGHRFAPPAVIWLPVQRPGLEAQWHALRCAVYSPRPPPATDLPADD